jgi:hypothetical protein
MNYLGQKNLLLREVEKGEVVKEEVKIPIPIMSDLYGSTKISHNV